MGCLNNQWAQVPLMVVDFGLRLMATNLRFIQTFRISPAAVMGCSLFEIDGGAWDVFPLRLAFDESFNNVCQNQNIRFATTFSFLGKQMVSLNIEPSYPQKGHLPRFVLLVNMVEPFGEPNLALL